MNPTPRAPGELNVAFWLLILALVALYLWRG